VNDVSYPNGFKLKYDEVIVLFRFYNLYGISRYSCIAREQKADPHEAI
jgi:hypothetical protein